MKLCKPFLSLGGSVGLAVLVLALPAPPARAQSTTATLRGTVSDEQGAPLPGATVTARQVETNVTRTVTTGSAAE